MAIKRKTTIIILSFTLIICVLLFMGFRGFVNSIRDQRTCEWANIDNIELHAHIDVPKVTKSDCHYEEERNIKMASFTIDTANFDITRYIQNYQLTKLNTSAELQYGSFLKLDKESLVGSDLYFKKDSAGGERYKVLLDKATGRLWVSIEFKD